MTWFVFKRSYGSYHFAEASNITSRTVSYAKYGNRFGRVDRSDVLFMSDDQKPTVDLHSRLEQSRQQMFSAQQQAADQHKERVARLLAEAAKQSSPVETK